MAPLRRVAPVLGILTLLVLLASAPGNANHDKKHPFAGSWIIDPKGKLPGKLQLRVVGDAEGRAAWVSIGHTLECLPVTNYYSGTFTTPTDSGPVVGCSEDHLGNQDFSGWYKSALAGGLTGKLDIVIERLIGGTTVTAFVTAPGQPVPVFGGTPTPLEFDGHFPGDGASGPGAVRVSFLVDAKHRDAKAKAQGLTAYSMTDGTGILEGKEDGTLSPAQKALIVLEHRDVSVTGKRHHTIDLAVLSGKLRKNRKELALDVQVIESSDRSCKEGAHGVIVMEFTTIQVGFSNAPRITTGYCGHSDLTLSEDPLFKWDVDDLEGLAPTEVRVSVDIHSDPGVHRASPTGKRLGVSQTRGQGTLQGPANGKLYTHGGKLLLIRHSYETAVGHGGGEGTLTLAATSGRLQWKSRKDYVLTMAARVVESDVRACPEGKPGTVLMRREADESLLIVDVCGLYDTGGEGLRSFPFVVQRTITKAD